MKSLDYGRGVSWTEVSLGHLENGIPFVELMVSDNQRFTLHLEVNKLLLT